MNKICFFMETPFTKGGEQRVVSIISNLLVQKGYDVSILCTDLITKEDYNLYNLSKKVKIKYVEGYNRRRYVELSKIRTKMYSYNLRTGRFKHSLLLQKIMNCDPFTRRLFIKRINRENFDYIVSLSTIYNTILATISKKLNCKTIGWQHSSSDRYFGLEGTRQYNQDKFSKYMFKRLDAYIVLTEFDKKWIKNKFNADVTVINNPKSIISDVTSNLKNKKFLAVGRFDPVKNYLELIDMFNKFHKVNKEWKLQIVGEGYLKDEYLKKIKEYNLEDFVEIKDYTNDISKYYLDSSIYLMSSLYEGWGMVMGEAIEFGLPIIAFNVASAKEMIKNKKNGFIVKKHNEKKYVKHMLELANNNEKLKEFSKNSKELSNNKSNDFITDKWICFLNSL